MNNNKGFSLVELMVVVAIIGILASIAVPNFQRFQAKTRQSEAKSKLTAIYTSEKAFHAEWNFYYGSLVDIGVQYEGESRYHVGFGANGAPGVLPTNFAPIAPGVVNTVGNYGGPNFPDAAAHPELAAVGGVAVVPGNCALGQTNPNGVYGSGAQFVAGAAGIIFEIGNQDEWTIDQAKNLCNNRAGFQ